MNANPGETIPLKAEYGLAFIFRVFFVWENNTKYTKRCQYSGPASLAIILFLEYNGYKKCFWRGYEIRGEAVQNLTNIRGK